MVDGSMSLERFQQLVKEMKPDNWRLGQTAFNVLDLERPDLADQVRGSSFDPFHDDGVLPRFYDWLALNWTNK